MIPVLTSPVIDQAQMMSVESVSTLSKDLESIYRSGGPQIVVLTVRSLEDQTVEERAIQVFEQWKIGKKGKDNGVLLLIAREEKKIRIEVGYGLEGDIPDAYAKRITENSILPFFRKGDFNSGILLGVQQIAHLSHVDLKNLTLSHGVPNSRPLPWPVALFYIVTGLIFFWLLIQPKSAARLDRQNRKYRNSYWGGGGGSSGDWGGGYSGGSSFGGWGDGGGGGGGSSGGGGASGGW